MKKWRYDCPICGHQHEVDWEQRGYRMICRKSFRVYVPPSPGEAPTAFLDSQEWTQEIAEAVRAMKGEGCTVPGCRSPAHTLVHRIPWSRDGTTSVENLQPICAEHHSALGETPFEEWLRDLQTVELSD